MRDYRNKFLAHLDSDAVMHIPLLDSAQASVRFYHRIVVAEAQAGDLTGLPDTPEKLQLGYQQCVDEGTKLFTAPP